MYETSIIGAIGNGIYFAGRHTTHCLVVELTAAPKPQDAGYHLKPIALNISRLGTSVIKYSGLGSFDRRFMRQMADYVGSQKPEDDALDTMTIVSLEVPGRPSNVVLSYHHAFPRNRSWVRADAWNQLTMNALDGSDDAAAKAYATACALLYDEERSTVRITEL